MSTRGAACCQDNFFVEATDDFATSVYMCPLHRISHLSLRVGVDSRFVCEGPTMIVAGRLCLVPDGDEV